MVWRRKALCFGFLHNAAERYAVEDRGFVRTTPYQEESLTSRTDGKEISVLTSI
jgi:hypothetical protein